jgi:hypothetical protein
LTNAIGSPYLAVRHGFTRVDHHGGPDDSTYAVVETLTGQVVVSGSAPAGVRPSP